MNVRVRITHAGVAATELYEAEIGEGLQWQCPEAPGIQEALQLITGPTEMTPSAPSRVMEVVLACKQVFPMLILAIDEAPPPSVPGRVY